MAFKRMSVKQFLIFKWSVYALLALNVFLYFQVSRFTESIDTFSWVVIIALYEWETTRLDEEYSNKFEMYAITFFRLFAYVVLVICDYEYFMDDKWLDFANATTWLLVCITLEYDVYYPGEFDSKEWQIRNYVKMFLYGLLLAYMLLWLIKGSALDFYDAFLWLLAFVAIELNIFGYEQNALDKKARKLKIKG